MAGDHARAYGGILTLPDRTGACTVSAQMLSRPGARAVRDGSGGGPARTCQGRITYPAVCAKALTVCVRAVLAQLLGYHTRPVDGGGAGSAARALRIRRSRVTQGWAPQVACLAPDDPVPAVYGLPQMTQRRSRSCLPASSAASSPPAAWLQRRRQIRQADEWAKPR